MRTDFDSFCTRMWLDYCDEHKDPIAALTRKDHDEYVSEYKDWLKDKYQETYGITNRQ